MYQPELQSQAQGAFVEQPLDFGGGSLPKFIEEYSQIPLSA